MVEPMITVPEPLAEDLRALDIAVEAVLSACAAGLGHSATVAAGSTH